MKKPTTTTKTATTKKQIKSKEKKPLILTLRFDV